MQNLQKRRGLQSEDEEVVMVERIQAYLDYMIKKV